MADAPGRFGATVTIDRPIDDVFAFLADGENDKKFSSRIVEIKKTTDGPPGAGSIYASTAKDGPMKAKHEFELIAFEPSTRIRWKEISKTTPVFVPEGGYDLEPAGEGTRVTFFNILEGRGLLGKLLAPVALRSARKGADAFAASIKAAVEAS
jgi:carbon monoxide dehydrogenase subunit G